jgi:hypothetical protein
MTVPAGGPARAEAPARVPAPDVTIVQRHPEPPPGRPPIEEICPYLAASGGAWRSFAPHRDHRCGAVDPPALLSADKQRRLCLSVNHGACSTFRAARASRAAMLAPGLDPTVVAAADAARRPLARSTPVVLEHPRLSAPTTRWRLDRALPQTALVALMIVAFAAVALARLSSDSGAGLGPSPSVSASPSPSRTPSPRPTPSPTPIPPSPSPSASVVGVALISVAEPPN